MRIYVGLGPDGKKRYDNYTVQGSRKDAEKCEREKKHAQDKGTYVSPSKITFKDHAEYWLTNKVSLLRPSTRASYESLMRNHAIPAIGDIQLDKLTPKDLQSLYTQKLQEGLSPRRVQYLHTVISGCLKYAVSMEVVVRNVAKAVAAPRPQHRDLQILSPAEIEVLGRTVQGHFLEPIVTVALGTGLRRGELLALRWSDVDLNGNLLTVRRNLVELPKGLVFHEPKTITGRRTVTLPSFAVRMLRQQKRLQAEHKLRLGEAYQDRGLVFAHQDGSPFRPSTVTNSFSAAVRRAGLPHISFHGLRHTHASLLLMQGVHPKVVQERLGHKTIAITLDIYSHVLPTLQRDVAAKLDTLIAL